MPGPDDRVELTPGGYSKLWDELRALRRAAREEARATGAIPPTSSITAFSVAVFKAQHGRYPTAREINVLTKPDDAIGQPT